MTSEVSFHQAAAEELQEIHQWYAERNRLVARRFLNEVNLTKDRISHDPESHPTESKHYRWTKIRRFPYRLIFEMTAPGKILILAIAHASRDPEYWGDRR